MGLLQITDDVRLSMDGVCVTLEKRVVSEKGKRAGEERWDSVGYYPNVATAAQALMNRHVALLIGDAPKASLQEFAAAVTRAADKVVSALRETVW